MRMLGVAIGAAIAVFACSAPEKGVEQGGGGTGSAVSGGASGTGAVPSGGYGGAGSAGVGGTAGSTGGAPSGGGASSAGGGTGGAPGGTGGVSGGTGGTGSTGGGASCSGPSTGCDPVHPDNPWPGFTACPTGGQCRLYAGVFQCATAGSGVEGSSCTSTTQCKPGFACDGSYCFKVCFDASDCAGKTCQPPYQPVGGCQLGHCT